MDLQRIIEKLDTNEKEIYINNTASSYFNTIYSSEKFSSIIKKLNTKEIITDEEWVYVVEKLLLVTNKAILEEEQLSFLDNIKYLLCKIIVKVLKSGSLYNECMKMIAFIASIKLERDINIDLSIGLDIVENSKWKKDLDILLKQHKEASLFRDSQDTFIDSYRVAMAGVMSDDEATEINFMDKCYNKEKELVKEYN